MDQQDSGCSAGKVVCSFFVGGLVGAGVALLMAPKTGEETRRMIKELAGEVKEKAEDYIGQVKDAATTYVEKGKDFIEKEKSVITKTMEAGKEAYEKEKNSEGYSLGSKGFKK
jgi:gas vesicle protein